MSAPSRIRQLGHGLALALFLYAAAVQLNDPDAPAWIALYFAAALGQGWAILRPGPWAAALALGAGALLWGLTLIPGVWEGGALLDTEEGREMLGLFLVAGATLPLAAIWRRPAAREGPR